MTTDIDYVGVDWSSGSWLAVGLTNQGEIEASTFGTIEQFWAEFGEPADTVVADVPIGLFEEGDRDGDEELVRECDYLARKAVGPQYRSIFNPPAREVVDRALEESYEEVKDRHEEITGKGLTQQAYSVASGIAEVDALLDSSKQDSIGDDFLEGHPEVCFAALGGPLSYSKKTAAGVHERIKALEEVDENAIEAAREICKQVADEAHHKVGFDDVLDALVLVYVAGYSEKERHTLPEEPPEDQQGRPMQMVYRADEGFDVSENTD